MSPTEFARQAFKANAPKLYPWQRKLLEATENYPRISLFPIRRVPQSDLYAYAAAIRALRGRPAKAKGKR